MTSTPKPGWNAILAAVTRDDVRARVLGRYRSAGFTPDDFHRSAKARACMADCLTRCEDHLELEHPRRAADRAALAVLRRRLENEIK
jgi:hypothetical protein